MSSITRNVVKQRRKVLIYSNDEIRNRFDSVNALIKFFLFFGWMTALFSPLLFFTWVLYLFYRYFDDLYTPLLAYAKDEMLYISRLAPKSTRKQFSTFGYQIPISQLENHIALYDHQDADALLAAKEKRYTIRMNKKTKTQRFGFDKDLFTRHLTIVGKTGSGKTVTILSIVDDLMRKGGGFIIIDGKADSKMWSTMYALAKKNLRETSYNTVNLLRAESKPDTNTINEIHNMHPVKAIGFLLSLVSTDSVDGNTKHFLNRGKAMLAPLYSALYLRNKFYAEPFANTSLSKASDIPEMNITFILFYCMAQSMVEHIENIPELLSAIREGKRLKVATIERFSSYEAILEYVAQNPSQKREIEKNLKLKYQFFEESYYNVLIPLRAYIASIYPQWIIGLETVAAAVFSYQKRQGVTFLYTTPSPQKPNAIRELLADFKRNPAKALESIREDHTIDENVLKKALDINSKDMGPKESINDIPEHAIQQHSFAVQQWTALFQVFANYSHVFGSSNPEISTLNTIANNQILYILLPGLDMPEDEAQILGRIFLTAIKESAAKSLGGEKMNLTVTQRNIYIDKLKPKPMYAIIPDEYGTYAIPGNVMATMSQQLRSINISMIISIQDKVSLKGSSDNTTGQLKTLANSSKIFLQIADNEIIEYAKGVIVEEEVATEEYVKSAIGEIVQSGSVKMEKRPILDPKICQSFQKGLAMVITDGYPVIVQSFYKEEIEANTIIVRLKKTS